MFSPRPPERLPFDASPAQRSYLRRSNEQLEALSRYQGEGVSGGTLPTEVIPPLIWIFGKIRNEEDDSSTDSDSSLSPAGTGFTDDEGFLTYAFDQIYDTAPWKGIIIPNGIRTTLPEKGVSGSNYAYPLNQDTYEDGTNVILKSAGNHWVIIGTVAGSSSSSDFADSFCFDVDCEAGTIDVVDCNSTNSSTTSSSKGTNSSTGSDTNHTTNQANIVPNQSGEPGGL